MAKISSRIMGAVMTQIDEPNLDKERNGFYGMTIVRSPDMLDEQLSRLIIENQSEDGSIDISNQKAMKDEILALIANQVQEARINELENLLADDGQCICQLANQKVCDHNWSLCNTVKDRIAQLRSTPNDQL